MIAFMLLSCVSPVDYDTAAVFCGPEGRPHVAWVADELVAVEVSYTSPDEPYRVSDVVEAEGCVEVVVHAPDCIRMSTVVVTLDDHEVIGDTAPCDVDPADWIDLGEEH
jgi:hypothetical protein